MADKKNDNEGFDLVSFSDQAAKAVEKYWKVFVGAVVVVLAIAGASQFSKSKNRSSEEMSFQELFKITKVYNDKKKAFDEAEKPEPPANKDEKAPKTKASTEPKVKASGDLAKDYDSVPADLASFIQKNPGKQATGEAALLLANIYQEYKQSDKALEVLESVSSNWPGRSLMFSLLRMKAGDLWSIQGDCPKAIENWRPLTERDNFLKDEATLKVGLCYQKQGAFDQAKTWYQKLTMAAAMKDPSLEAAGQPESPSVLSARKFLRYLQFQEKMPAPAEQSVDKSNTPADKES